MQERPTIPDELLSGSPPHRSGLAARLSSVAHRCPCDLYWSLLSLHVDPDQSTPPAARLISSAEPTEAAMIPATYSIRERLRDGRPIEIRALRADDETGMLAAVDRTNPESLRRRFFVTKRGFSEKEKAFFMNVDFINHVALVAEIDEDGRPAIIGGGRYIVVRPGAAEV